jgi:glycine oxidase
VVGSTVERVGFDGGTTAEAIEALREAAVELVPALGNAPVAATWAGLRPASRSALPLIGPHPVVTGLYLNTAHFRNGICLAPASGRLLADIVVGRVPSVDPVPFRPTSD